MPKFMLCGTLSLVILVFLFGESAYSDDTLYRQLGEKPGLTQLIFRTTSIALQDNRIKGQFDNINMARLRVRLVDHMCVITGGPCTYGGRDMAAAHKGLHLHNFEFNAITEDLQTSMEDMSIPFTTQMRLLAILAPMERLVVTE